MRFCLVFRVALSGVVLFVVLLWPVGYESFRFGSSFCIAINVDYLNLDMFMGGFRCGMTLEVGKAMLMRGGASAAELGLMVG
jgi:hypothetical protein